MSKILYAHIWAYAPNMIYLYTRYPIVARRAWPAGVARAKVYCIQMIDFDP